MRFSGYFARSAHFVSSWNFTFPLPETPLPAIVTFDGHYFAEHGMP